MKRDWDKIYFFLLLTLLFAGLFWASARWVVDISEEQKEEGRGECEKLGLRLYPNSKADCIDSMGALYDIDLDKHVPVTLTAILLMLSLAITSISFGANVIGEYNKCN